MMAMMMSMIFDPSVMMMMMLKMMVDAVVVGGGGGATGDFWRLLAPCCNYCPYFVPESARTAAFRTSLHLSP